MDCSICIIADAAPVYCGIERAKHKSETVDLLVDLNINVHDVTSPMVTTYG